MATDIHIERAVCSLDDPMRTGIEKCVLVAFFLAATFAFAFLSPEVSWGIAAGGCISLFSFFSLRRTLEKTFGFMLSGSGGSGGYITFRYYIKISLLITLLFLLLRDSRVSAVGIAAGLFVVPATLIYWGLKLFIVDRRKQIP